MKGELADRLYALCRELVVDTTGNTDDLYNILEGHILQYLSEIEGDE